MHQNGKKNQLYFIKNEKNVYTVGRARSVARSCPQVINADWDDNVIDVFCIATMRHFSRFQRQTAADRKTLNAAKSGIFGTMFKLST